MSYFLSVMNLPTLENLLKHRSLFYVLLTVHLDSRVKKNQLDAQLILSIFRQPLHVSGVSRPIITRYNRMYEGKSENKVPYFIATK